MTFLNTNKYKKTYHFLHTDKFAFILIILMSLASISQLSDLGHDNSDMSRYLANGMNLLTGGEQLNIYPSILFQLLSAFFSGFIFGKIPQIVYIAYVSCILFALTNIFLYKICRLFFGISVSLLIVYCIIELPFLSLYKTTATRALTDPWVLFFFIISTYYILIDKPFLSGLFAGISILFRVQSFQFLLMPFAYMNLKKYLKHTIVLFLTYIIINFVFHLLFNLNSPNSDFSFHEKVLSFYSQNIIILLKQATIVLLEYPFVVMFLCAIVINIFMISKKSNLGDPKSLILKINIISLTVLIPMILLAHYYFYLFKYFSLHSTPNPPTRYLIYGFPIAFISICIFIKILSHKILDALPAFRKFYYKYESYLKAMICLFLLIHIAINIKLNNPNFTINIVNFNPIAANIHKNERIGTYPKNRHYFVYIYHQVLSLDLKTFEDILEKDYDVLYLVKKWSYPRKIEPTVEKIIQDKYFYNQRGELFTENFHYKDNCTEIYIYRKKSAP